MPKYLFVREENQIGGINQLHVQSLPPPAIFGFHVRLSYTLLWLLTIRRLKTATISTTEGKNVKIWQFERNKNI